MVPKYIIKIVRQKVKKKNKDRFQDKSNEGKEEINGK